MAIGLIEEENKAVAAVGVRKAVAEYLFSAQMGAIRIGCDGRATIKTIDDQPVLDLLGAVADGRIDYFPGMAGGLVDNIAAAYCMFK